MNFKIKITKELIDRSIRCSSNECVMAKAIKELLPEGWVSVGVGSYYIAKDPRHNYFERKSTPEMCAIIRTFDGHNNEVIVGREVEIEIPDEVINESFEDEVQLARQLSTCKTISHVCS